MLFQKTTNEGAITMAAKKTTAKTEQAEAKKVPAIAKSAALAEPEKKKLPAKTNDTGRL